MRNSLFPKHAQRETSRMNNLSPSRKRGTAPMAKDVALPFRPLLDEQQRDVDALPFTPKRQRRRFRNVFILLAVVLALAVAVGSLLSWLLNRTPAVQYT